MKWTVEIYAEAAKLQAYYPGLTETAFYTFDRPLRLYYNDCLKVCPVCCRIWAKLSAGGRIHCVDEVCCSSCYANEYFSQVPGSLITCTSWKTIDYDLLNYLPRALLIRELELTIKATQNAPSVTNSRLTLGLSDYDLRVTELTLGG